MNGQILNLFRIITDDLLIMYFFRSIPKKQMSPQKYILLSIAAFLPTVVYLFSYASSSILNMSIRFLSFFLFLFFVKKGSVLHHLYISLYALCLFTACQNISMTPALYRLFSLKYMSSYNSVWQTVLLFLISLLVKFVLLASAEKIVPCKRIVSPSFTAWITSLLVLSCGSYIKSILRSIIETSTETPRDLDIFSLFLQVFLLYFLALFERNRYSHEIQKEVALQNSINEKYLLSMEKEMESQETIRGIRHDMKNHLLAMRGISDNAKLDQYIGSLLQEMEVSVPGLETGNAFVSRFLNQKIGENRDILFDVSLDLTGLMYIEDYDLCTIFGNAVDNAIEAIDRIQESV